MSIEYRRLDVEAKHPPVEIIANQQTSDLKASVESTVQDCGVSNGCLAEGGLLLAKELKEHISFRELLQADKHDVQESGRYVKCRCPFHPDRTPSFFVNEDDNGGKCYGCEWYGDIFAYEMEFHRVEFKEAWFRLNDFVKQDPRKGRKAKKTIKRVELTPLSPEQLKQRAAYAGRLATDRWIAENICEKRFARNRERWNPDTLQKLAQGGSLGWAGDALAFIYPTGTKYRRWPEKEFVWEGSTSLWRGDLLAAADHVYLTESETDAIALIDSNVEQTPGSVVIAAPSATSFKEEWAALFKGKTVTLCFDNDKAGENAVQTIAFLLKPYAKEVRALDWKEVA